MANVSAVRASRVSAKGGSASTPSSEAAEAWDRTKDTTSNTLLETFIARYKDTYYADLARARIEEIKKRQVVIATPPAPPPARPMARCDGIEITVAQYEQRCFKPGAGKTEHFKDCDTCPEMVVVPAGNFKMGSPADEPERDTEEAQVRVTISTPFAVGKYAVT